MSHVVFIGNPGVGKSMLLNSLLGKKLFRSGISFGKGMTQILHTETVDGVKYSDTPGLDDIEMRKLAAAEISAALKGGGSFKLIFVCTLESGRLRPSDVATVQTVLAAVEEVGIPTDNLYSVLVNKCTVGELELLQDNANRERIRFIFSKQKMLQHITFFEMLRDAEGVADFLIPDVFHLREFVNGAPTVDIPVPKAAKVSVNADGLEKLKEELEQKVAELEKELDELRKEKNDDRYWALINSVGAGVSTGAGGVLASKALQFGGSAAVNFLSTIARGTAVEKFLVEAFKRM